MFFDYSMRFSLNQKLSLSKSSNEQQQLFTSIPAFNQPSLIEGEDLKVGLWNDHSIYLRNGSITRINDLYLHGKLTFIASDREDKNNPPVLVIQNAIILGQLKTKNILVRCSKYIYVNSQFFEAKLDRK